MPHALLPPNSVHDVESGQGVLGCKDPLHVRMMAQVGLGPTEGGGHPNEPMTQYCSTVFEHARCSYG